MARVRILKRQEKAYIELPPEMAGGEEVELFALREGYYLLSVPLGEKPQAPGRAEEPISERERDVLRKLLSIRFENRVPAYVNKALTEQELQVLKELERKGLVNVFRGKKYTEGVYNIKDSIYPLLSQKPAAQAEQAPPRPAQGPPGGSSAYIGQLNSRGFVVVQDKKDAFMLSEVLNGRMKSGDVVGVKGFDNKFYIVTRDYFTAASGRVGQALKEDMDHGSIASAAKLDPEGCMAVLRLMAENGEIIEKKKGIFAPV